MPWKIHGNPWKQENRGACIHIRSNSLAAMNTFVPSFECSFSLHVKYLTYATFPPTKRFPGVLINKELIVLILIYVPARLLVAFSTRALGHFRNWSNPLSNSKHELDGKKKWTREINKCQVKLMSVAVTIMQLYYRVLSKRPSSSRLKT